MQDISTAWSWLLDRWHLSDTPPWWATLTCAVVVTILCLAPHSWHFLRNVATAVHEMGHVLVAWLFGRRIAGVALHSDTSGLTVTAGRQRGLGVLLTYLAGYPAPTVAGAALTWAALTGWAGAGLTLTVLLLLCGFWLAKNAYGFIVMTVLLLGTGYIWWTGNARAATIYVLTLGVLLVVAGLRCSLDLWHAHAGSDGDTGSSDAAMAAHHSLLPVRAWLAFFCLVGVVGVAWTAVFAIRDYL